MEELSPAEMQEHLGKWTQWVGGLAKEGRLKEGLPLAQGSACVREDLVSDGPYLEAKDVVGGFMLVACDSLQHAIEIAKACPTVTLGGLVEVRETAPNVMNA